MVKHLPFLDPVRLQTREDGLILRPGWAERLTPELIQEVVWSKPRARHTEIERIRIRMEIRAAQLKLKQKVERARKRVIQRAKVAKADAAKAKKGR
jgi:hypothetical protein